MTMGDKLPVVGGLSCSSWFGSSLVLPPSAVASSFTTPPQALAWPWRRQPSPSPQQQHVQQGSYGNQRNGAPSRKHRKIKTAILPLAVDQGKSEDGSREGHVWLPGAPLITRPRASYNAASLAYLGDCVYELYVRCHFLTPPRTVDKYNTLVMSLVCCEAQDVLLNRLLKDDFLSDEERDVVRWGKNIQTGQKRATRRAGSSVYSRASSLETLIGYLYLTSPNRLEQVMKKLGLSWNSSLGGDEVKLELQS